MVQAGALSSKIASSFIDYHWFFIDFLGVLRPRCPKSALDRPYVKPWQLLAASLGLLTLILALVIFGTPGWATHELQD